MSHKGLQRSVENKTNANLKVLCKVLTMTSVALNTDIHSQRRHNRHKCRDWQRSVYSGIDLSHKSDHSLEAFFHRSHQVFGASDPLRSLVDNHRQWRSFGWIGFDGWAPGYTHSDWASAQSLSVHWKLVSDSLFFIVCHKTRIRVKYLGVYWS